MTSTVGGDRDDGARLSFDVIVVGAGSAGCATTRRLVDAGRRVLLLEAGGEDHNPKIHHPHHFNQLWHGPEDWDYHTVPQPGAGDRRLHWPRGRVLGGSSSLNAMIVVRGAPADYDHWAYLGNTGWSWADVLPVFKRIENFDGGPSESRGVGGPLNVVSRYQPDPIHRSIVAAAGEVGVGLNPDYNTGEQDGISYIQFSVLDGKRHSAAAAYLRPVIDAPNLTLLVRARARRLVFQGARCVGVEFERDGVVSTARADGEVVVCGGALESPRLLMASGVGPAEQLRPLGVEVVSDLPGVGQNLHDHLLAPVIFGVNRPLDVPSALVPPVQTHLFWRSRPGLLTPDVQPLHFPVPMYEPWMTGPPDGFTLQAGMVRPVSRGSLRLSGAGPDAELLIDPGLLRREADVDSLAAAVTLCREIGAAAALRDEWGASELYPGPKVRSAQEVRAYARSVAISYHHQVGTCAMGVHEQAVVDPLLRVYGVQGLRVADASVMPAVPTGNTNLPAIMIGERAADFVVAADR